MFRLTPYAMCVGLLAAATPAAAEPGHCYPNWTEAAPIVARERLVTVATLTELARSRLPGDMVRATLCRVETKFVYRIVVREPQGPMRSHTLDARKPFDK